MELEVQYVYIIGTELILCLRDLILITKLDATCRVVYILSIVTFLQTVRAKQYKMYYYRLHTVLVKMKNFADGIV